MIKLITPMTTNKTTIKKLFDESPEDIQFLILSKIVYTQPKKLLEHIRTKEELKNGFLFK